MRRRNWTRARAHSFCTALGVRPIASATSLQRLAFQLAKHQHLAVVGRQLAQGVGQQHGPLAALGPLAG